MQGLPKHVKVAIVGAGFAGLGAAIRLIQEGERDLVVLERSTEVGGTWRDNTYPGCQCDVPSVLYSFSFAPNPGWSRAYSPQPEIWAYLRECVERFGLAPYLRLGVDLERAWWDDDEQVWRVSTSSGEVTADVLVAATGPLCEPSIPDLPGLESFEGPVFHSARWRHDVDLAGRDVAMVGTGASSVQIVPKIAPDVRSLTVFQRTPPWVVPRANRPWSGAKKAVYQRLPLLQRLARGATYLSTEALVVSMLHPRVARVAQRMALAHLHRQVADPALRAVLTPTYAMGCKRILPSSTYYPALQRDNVRLEPTGVVEVRPRSVVGADGREHAVDTIVLATGFRVTDPPVAERLVGRDGRTLAQIWGGSPQAYGTVAVHGFPNLFLLLGPNSGTGHTSVLVMAEAEIEQMLLALRLRRSRGATSIEPSARAQTDFVADVDRRMRGSVWTAGGCQSWYIDRTGRNSAIWPGLTMTFRRRMARLHPEDYELGRPHPVAS